MTDLESFRDHCRAMAGEPIVPGCPAADERTLWLQMGDEIDRWLTEGLDDDEQEESLW